MVNTACLPPILLLLADWLVGRREIVSPVEVPTGDEEAGWMIRVAAGDETGLQHLYDRWKRPLLSFFYRSLGSHADAEDLALEVFVRLHRSAADYRPTAKFSTYLFHIAQNLLRNELRRRRRKPADAVPPELFEELSEENAPDRRLAELEEVFQQALTRLPEKHRTALLLILQQQLDYPTAAAALRMTENALRVLVHRARQLLKTEMEARP
jgi:RNA polymerase sigma-70 factor (ECF subfamily)